MAMKANNNFRHSKDYDIKLVSNKGNVGEIEEVSFASSIDQEGVPEGFEIINIGLKVKEVWNKTKATPSDVFQISITGKPGSRNMGISEAFQQVKLTLGKEENAPDEFEDLRRYIFTGLKIKESAEETIEPQKISATINTGGRSGRR